jgi:hypothetical protein
MPVDAISHSQSWSDTLILITEDDPSGATDHVDLHRSFALVVSPWARRGRPFTALPSNVAPKTNPLRPGWRARDFSGVDRARLGVELWQAARPGEPVPGRLLEAEGDDDAD